MSEIKSIVNKIGTNNHIYSPEEVRLFFEMQDFKENCVGLLKKKSPATIDYLEIEYLEEMLIMQALSSEKDKNEKENENDNNYTTNELIYLYMTNTKLDDLICKYCHQNKTDFISNELGYEELCFVCKVAITSDEFTSVLENWEEDDTLIIPTKLFYFCYPHSFVEPIIEFIVFNKTKIYKLLLELYDPLFDKAFGNEETFNHIEFNRAIYQAACSYMSNRSLDDQKCIECGHHHTVFRNYKLGYGSFCSNACAKRYKTNNFRNLI